MCLLCDITDDTKCEKCVADYSLVVSSTTMLGDGADGDGAPIDADYPTACVLSTDCTGAESAIGFPATDYGGRALGLAAPCDTTCAYQQCIGFASYDCTSCAESTNILVKFTSSADTVFACLPSTVGCRSGYLERNICSPTLCSGDQNAFGTTYNFLVLQSFTCSTEDCKEGQFEWESSLGITFCLSEACPSYYDLGDDDCSQVAASSQFKLSVFSILLAFVII